MPGQAKLFKIPNASPAIFGLFLEPPSADIMPTRKIKGLTRVWNSEIFARNPPDHEKSILSGSPNLLPGLWLKDAPAAYSFCNLDLHPITSYSSRTVFRRFRPPTCIEWVEGLEIDRCRN
jgi:hypothetical protein